MLAVDNSVPGIAPVDREHVLERFFRSPDASASREGSGLGLGLAIVQTIAQRHHATLALDHSANRGRLRLELVFPPGWLR